MAVSNDGPAFCHDAECNGWEILPASESLVASVAWVMVAVTAGTGVGHYQ